MVYLFLKNQCYCFFLLLMWIHGNIYFVLKPRCCYMFFERYLEKDINIKQIVESRGQSTSDESEQAST